MRDDFDRDNNARGGALLALLICAVIFVIVSLIVFFLFEAGYLSLQ